MEVQHPTASAQLKIVTDLIFSALDLVSEEICDRFKPSSMFFPKKLESLLMKASNNVHTNGLQYLKQ